MSQPPSNETVTETSSTTTGQPVKAAPLLKIDSRFFVDRVREMHCFFSVLRIIRLCQQQHGLRHGDYQRYRYSLSHHFIASQTPRNISLSSELFVLVVFDAFVNVSMQPMAITRNSKNLSLPMNLLPKTLGKIQLHGLVHSIHVSMDQL